MGKGRDREATAVIHRMAEINQREVPYHLHLQDNRVEAKDARVSFAVNSARVDIQVIQYTPRIILTVCALLCFVSRRFCLYT